PTRVSLISCRRRNSALWPKRHRGAPRALDGRRLGPGRLLPLGKDFPYLGVGATSGVVGLFKGQFFVVSGRRLEQRGHALLHPWEKLWVFLGNPGVFLRLRFSEAELQVIGMGLLLDALVNLRRNLVRTQLLVLGCGLTLRRLGAIDAEFGGQ